MPTLTYVVTSKSARVIDGLGVFTAGETKEFDATAGPGFRNIRGVQLLPANLPDDVHLTIHLFTEAKEV
jgi:hypothetical protein